jgi:hypothetical protein
MWIVLKHMAVSVLMCDIEDTIHYFILNRK